jgi:hypothetical protein
MAVIVVTNAMKSKHLSSFPGVTRATSLNTAHKFRRLKCAEWTYVRVDSDEIEQSPSAGFVIEKGVLDTQRVTNS